MVKTSKFILAVILLIFSVLLVGCLFFTGNRLANYPEDLGGFKREVYQDEDTHFQFWEDGIWYQNGEDDLMFFEIVDFEDGVLTASKEERELTFVVIDNETIYDDSTNSLLTRTVQNG